MTTRAWRDRGRVWTCPLSLDTYNAIATQQTLFTISGSNNSQNESKWQYKRVNISSIECVTTKIRTKWNKLSSHLVPVLTPRVWWKVWDVTVPCDVCSHSGNSNTFASILHCRDVRYTDIPKIPVLKLISVYRYDFFSHTDIPKFPVYRKTSVYRYCRNSSKFIGIQVLY